MVWTSIFGIVTLVLLARALGFARAPVLDAAMAKRVAADALHGFLPADMALAKDGRGALVAGRDGRVALVCGHGDRWVVRTVNGVAARVEGGRLRIDMGEWQFPVAELELGDAARVWARRL